MCSQSACLRGCKVTLVAFVLLLPTVCLKMSPQNVSSKRLIITLIAFVWLGKSRFHMHNMCIFKSLSLLTWIFVQCVSNVSQTWLPERKQSHTGCICLAFTGVHFQMSPQMTCLRGMRHSIQISDMKGQLGQSLISWEISTFSPLNLSVYIVNQSWIIFLSIFMKFLLKLWNVICYIWMIFFPMRFQKTLQKAWPRKQFWLIFATVHFKMSPQVACLTRGKVTWLHLFDFSPLCIFKCFIKELALEDA